MSTDATTWNPRSFAITVAGLALLGGVVWYYTTVVSAGLPESAQAIGPSNATSLIAAAERGDAVAIEAELKRGASIDRLHNGGDGQSDMTALMAAAAAGKSEAVRVLIKGGAQPNVRSKDGRTALMYAAGWGNPATVRALLDSQARVDERSESRMTALSFAAARGEIDSVRSLIDAGADVNAKNRWGQTPLAVAALAGDAAKVSALLAAGALVNDADNDRRTALAVAAGADNGAAALKVLIAAKADPNLSDAEGVTPLMIAADKGDVEKITALLDAGASVKATDKAGRTAADWASARADEAGDRVMKVLTEAQSG